MRLHATSASGTGSLHDPRTASDLRARTTADLSVLLAEPHAVELTSSCTHALEAAALILEVGPDDEVIVPAFAFPSAANAFLLRGATIRFADVDPRTANVDPLEIDRLTTPRTRAVVCVHYGGVACDMDGLQEQAVAGGWALVEDAAHGLFGRHRSRPLGTLGAAGCLSFQRTKNISSVDGGALIINDVALTERAAIALDKGTNRVAFEAGRVSSYEWSGLGSAWRLSDALVGDLAAQLGNSQQIQTRRHEVWRRYAEELTPWAEGSGTLLPQLPEHTEHPAHLFWMLLPDRIDRRWFAERCAAGGVQVARHFGALPTTAFGRTIAHPDDRCPTAERFGRQLVRLPMHQKLTPSDVDRVLEVVTASY